MLWDDLPRFSLGHREWVPDPLLQTRGIYSVRLAELAHYQRALLWVWTQGRRGAEDRIAGGGFLKLEALYLGPWLSCGWAVSIPPVSVQGASPGHQHEGQESE